MMPVERIIRYSLCFYRGLFKVLMDILETNVWQHLSADEQIVTEYKQVG